VPKEKLDMATTLRIDSCNEINVIERTELAADALEGSSTLLLSALKESRTADSSTSGLLPSQKPLSRIRLAAYTYDRPTPTVHSEGRALHKPDTPFV
jgi:hypothetical protein